MALGQHRMGRIHIILNVEDGQDVIRNDNSSWDGAGQFRRVMKHDCRELVS